MSVPVAVIVEVDGVRVVTPGGSLRAIDSAQVTWGRSTVLAQPTPARGSATVLDTSPGRDFAARRDLVGRMLNIGYAAADGPSAWSFAGRITAVSRRRGVAGGVAVQLEASALEVDAGNYLLPEGTVWPAETFAARLARIMALFPAWEYGGAELPPEWTGYLATQADVGGADALSLLRKLYDSCAVPLVYSPVANVFTYARRRHQPTATGPGQHVAALDHRERFEASCSPVGGTALAASDLAYDGDLVSDQAAQLTRVEVRWSEPVTGAAPQARTLSWLVGGELGEEIVGRRTLSVDTWHATADGAAAALAAWAALCTGEMRVPRLEPVTFSTRRTPFDSGAQAGALLAGAESSQWIFLRGSWLPELRVAPYVGVVGGTVTFDGQWTVALRLAPAVNDNTPPGLLVRTAAADSTVRLTDLAESLTFGDCEHVTVGAGYTPATMPITL